MPKRPQYNSVLASVCKVVLFGTCFVIVAIAILLWVSLVQVHNTQALGRLLWCGIALLYIAVAYVFLRRNYYRIVGYQVVLFYLLLGGIIVWNWGINTPIGVLIFGLDIVLAGILLTARWALWAVVASGLILIGIQVAIALDLHKPDTSWMGDQSYVGDVLAYCTVFSMLGLVSWLYNREMERSLAHAKSAEVALLHQKATLKTQVKERTAELRRAQLEEMRHIYRFAELGQLGVALLHDLANHLTALTLEIEGLQSKQHSKAIEPARRIIQYLGDIVDNTRERLRGDPQKQTFNIVRRIGEVIDFLQYKATKAGVVIGWYPPPHPIKYTGDATSLCQVVAIIISNAIDAYGASKTSPSSDAKRIVVAMQQNDTHIIIRVSDWGRGIGKSERKQLFKPVHSTKKTGLGIGLFIARQTIEMQFSGTLTLNTHSDHTEFVVKLSLRNER